MAIHWLSVTTGPDIYECLPVSSARSENMRHIKSSATIPEMLLGKAMWQQGLRYRKNRTDLTGRPDFVFVSAKVAVFVDGEFWHGYLWEDKKKRLHDNRDYWIAKIERNMSRDHAVDKTLTDTGWRVLRFWAHEVLDDTRTCAGVVHSAVLNGNNRGKVERGSCPPKCDDQNWR